MLRKEKCGISKSPDPETKYLFEDLFSISFDWTNKGKFTHFHETKIVSAHQSVYIGLIPLV